MSDDVVVSISSGVRKLHPGMGQAVAERTILRKKEDGTVETWKDVAARVALGNVLLTDKVPGNRELEESLLRKHIANASLLMSGRHLQHGDESQPTRNMEVFTNCSTAATSFAQFYMLMNGSGVGRCYDDDMILADLDNAPNVRCVLDENHPDFDYSAHEDARSAKHKYRGKNVMWFTVPDSREGWAKALEIWENAAFEKIHKDKTLVLDFSIVRHKGAPIGGMQNRPSSGPVPLMNAFQKAMTLKGAGMDAYMQAMYLDHYFAECVLVGGARRSARMSTKTWRDRNVIEFIRIKRPIEYDGLNLNQVVEIRNDRAKSGLYPYQSFLWSSNNSVTVDADFWRLVEADESKLSEAEAKEARHARRVLKTINEASYGDGTGEPGLINVDKLVQNDEGFDTKAVTFGSKKYQIEDETELFMRRVAKRVKHKPHNMIVNPCGEIALSVLGGFCVIADVVPFHCETLEEAEEAFRVATRALMRVNLMDSVYPYEVKRTNRIGVGMTGVNEFAWKFFKIGFRDAIAVDTSGGFKPSNETEEAALKFWETLSRFSNVVDDEAKKYAKMLGVNVPHTLTTIKPAGTTSKLFGLTEGWHLPSMAWYMRWVQFTEDNPLVEEYKAKGYPVRKLTKSVKNTVIVGFPTKLAIGDSGMGDKLVFAGEATPEEQYKWLMLGERYWIEGKTNDPKSKGHGRGNQISYTLKYKPDVVNFKEFSDMLIKYQSKIRCCSVMPQDDDDSLAAHEYLPEQPLNKAEYEAIYREVNGLMQEDIGLEHIDCASGACPVDFNSTKASDAA
jgi:adenosylcobalamin-dependent ribonucleoside-triphosphate reductase